MHQKQPPANAALAGAGSSAAAVGRPAGRGSRAARSTSDGRMTGWEARHAAWGPAPRGGGGGRMLDATTRAGARRRMPHRVIQWSTGNVGKLALRGIIHHPGLELVGLWVHGRDKVAGTLASCAGSA